MNVHCALIVHCEPNGGQIRQRMGRAGGSHHQSWSHNQGNTAMDHHTPLVPW